MKTREQVIEEIRVDMETQRELDGIEEQVMGKTSLADLMRGGAKHSVQERNWGQGDRACALSAAAQAAAALGVIDTK